MRIKLIDLSWFRGAAEQARLNLNEKSAVIYGRNGSGKSSFVDALEYLLNGYQLQHQRHEHSGNRHIKGVRNTHAPSGERAEVSVTLADRSQHQITIDDDGNIDDSSLDLSAIPSWDYRRTILRQDELSEFIHQTKGEKYSTLLPLLGLEGLENIAHNLGRVRKEVDNHQTVKSAAKKCEQARDTVLHFLEKEDEEHIAVHLDGLLQKYEVERRDTSPLLDQAKAARDRINNRFEGTNTSVRLNAALLDLARLNLVPSIASARKATEELANVTEEYISEKLEILGSTLELVEHVDEAVHEIDCPSCGRSISVSDLRSHVEVEHQRLETAINAYKDRRSAFNQLQVDAQHINSALARDEVVEWINELEENPQTRVVLPIDELQKSLDFSQHDEHLLSEVERRFVPLVNEARVGAENVPPEASELSTDLQKCSAIVNYLECQPEIEFLSQVGQLRELLEQLERQVREEIRLRSTTIIQEITDDVQAMWKVLHPNQPIEDVRLEFSENVDKGIDITLRFYGIEQDSPRLSLSEGYRNSLGLCVFLAMAKQVPDDRPVILDDVVISLDREHRGMVAKLLEAQFADRQVILFTHDRDWFTELPFHLDMKRWRQGTVLPFKDPITGIRIEDLETSFDSARALIGDRPELAANDARRIMDTQLPIVGERLNLRIPFRRGAKNETITSGEFVKQLLSSGKNCFQISEEGSHVRNQAALDCLQLAASKLVSWANRGTHSYDVTDREAADLIDACEAALECFKCMHCEKPVWYRSSRNSDYLECSCGSLRWRCDKD